MSEIELIEKWLLIMLRTIRDSSLGPTYTARLQYLFSTIIYYALACYVNNNSFRPNYGKNNYCIVEPELKLQTLSYDERKISVIDSVIYDSINYLYDLLSYKKTSIVADQYTETVNSKIMFNNIKMFLDRRNSDGWSTANVQPVLPNGSAFIDVENAQDLNTLLQNKDKWTPLKHKNAPGPQKYLTPGWGTVSSVENMNIDKYIKIADENYIATERDNEIKEIINIYENLNDFQKMIAEFFQGGQVTPPGIWNVLAIYTIKGSKINFIDAAQFLYLLNSVMFTGSIVAWNIKRKYMQSRPIQDIRLLPSQSVKTFDSSTVNNNIWKPFQQQNFQTPPFPDYISGHSTFSSGAACVFEKFFPLSMTQYIFDNFNNEYGAMISPLLNNNPYDNNVKVTMIKANSSTVIHDTSDKRFPSCAIKLTFNNWKEMAYYSGISRIYGGIHGNNANNVGLIIGEIIANDLLNSRLNKKNN